MHEIKISIIIPVYNVEKYIKKCLISITNQSLKELEIIVVNDGSSDNSLEIIKKIKEKDSRIKIIDKKNGGLSSARNIGIRESCGEYILNIDGDDWIEKECCKEMYEKAINNNLDIVIADMYWNFGEENVQYRHDLQLNEEKIISNIKYLENFFNNKIFPNSCNKLYKAELYKKNNIYHPLNISMGEDLSTTPRLAYYAERIGKINKSYYHYIQHNSESLTKKNSRKRIYELLEAFKILEDFFSKDYDVKNLKMLHMEYQLFRKGYNIKDKFYNKAICEYICLCKEKRDKNIRKNLKMRTYIFLLRTIPSLLLFRYIYYFDQFGVFIKQNIKKIKGK